MTFIPTKPQAPITLTHAEVVRSLAQDDTRRYFIARESEQCKTGYIDTYLGVAGLSPTPANRKRLRLDLGIRLVSDGMREAAYGNTNNTFHMPYSAKVMVPVDKEGDPISTYSRVRSLIIPSKEVFWPIEGQGDITLEKFFTPIPWEAENPPDSVYPGLLKLGKSFTRAYGTANAEDDDFAQAALISLWEKIDLFRNVYRQEGREAAAKVVRSVAIQACKDLCLGETPSDNVLKKSRNPVQGYGYAKRLKDPETGKRRYHHWLDLPVEAQPPVLADDLSYYEGSTGGADRVIDAIKEHPEAKVLLLAWAGYTNAEIGTMVGKKTEAVKKLRQRALDSLLLDLRG